MPRGNGRGPMGQGPMTGRGGFGRFFGRGCGARGFGRTSGNGCRAPVAPTNERELLSVRESYLAGELEAIRARIAGLEADTSEK